MIAPGARKVGRSAAIAGTARPQAAPQLWIGTFHAFGLELLYKWGTHLGLAQDLHVVDESAALALLERQLPHLQLQHYQNLYDPALQLRYVLRAIFRAKDELIRPAQYRACAQTMLDQATDEAIRAAAQAALEVAQGVARTQEFLGEDICLDLFALVRGVPFDALHPGGPQRFVGFLIKVGSEAERGVRMEPKMAKLVGDAERLIFW